MSATTVTNPADLRIPSHAAVKIALIGLAFVGFFWSFLYNQARISRDPDWSHAYLVPVISVYYIFINRDRILSRPVRVNWLGLPIMLAGMAMYFFFTLGSTANHTFQGVGAVVTLLGVTLLLLGRSMWTALLFPQLYLLLAIRMPPRVMLMVTPTLQRWAAQGSYVLLNILGYDTDIAGNVLTVHHRGQTIPLNVAEACSGMRMVVAFIALGVAVAFLSCRWWWQRIVLVALAVPIAVLINVFRVGTIGVMSTVDRNWAGGDAHMAIGMVWLVPALVIYLGVVWILQHLVIDDESRDRRDVVTRAAS